MNQIPKFRLTEELNQQSANALLAATFDFLRRNKISAKSVVEFAVRYHARHHRRRSLSLHRKLMQIYDEMGVIMATWYSDTRFLDASGYPRPLSKGGGPSSIAYLIRVSGARVKPSVAIELMEQSPSVRLTSDGTYFPLRRVFILRNFSVPRAAFVVKRYLETLQKNAFVKFGQKPVLLERSCHVSEADLTSIIPLLRDIEGRGTALMDSVDGQIEALRLRRAKAKRVGEIGVLAFAWAIPKAKGSKKINRS